MLLVILAMFLSLALVGGYVDANKEADYRLMIDKRHEILNKNDWKIPADAWKLVREAWPCPDARRFGSLGDGGKWVCFSKHNCTVLSLGIETEFSFETELVESKRCKVFGYDPTIAGSDAVRKVMKFYKKGVKGGANSRHLGELSTVKQMLEENHVDRVDIFKIDVEEAEYGMFDDLFQDYPNALPFDQLLIEFHINRHDIRQVVTIVEKLESYGFRIFEMELNPFTPIAAELALVQKDATHAHHIAI